MAVADGRRHTGAASTATVARDAALTSAPTFCADAIGGTVRIREADILDWRIAVADPNMRPGRTSNATRIQNYKTTSRNRLLYPAFRG